METTSEGLYKWDIPHAFGGISKAIQSFNAKPRQLEILQSVVNAAFIINNYAKALPRTTKKRNIFLKQYNRRPQTKSKTTLFLVKATMAARMGVLQISTLGSQPIPKGTNQIVFESGSCSENMQLPTFRTSFEFTPLFKDSEYYKDSKIELANSEVLNDPVNGYE